MKKIINNIYKYILNRNQKTAFEVMLIILSKYGYWRSLKSGIPCDANGKNIPWYTYPAIEFLDRLDFSKSEIFEWGSGYSSLYWSRKARMVTSIEDDSVWFKKMLKKKKSNMQLRFYDKESDYISSLTRLNRKVDVIIVDGSHRTECVKEAVKHLKVGGLIILDNSDWYPQTSLELRNAGYTEVSFSGLSCLNDYTLSTSIFFKNKINFGYLKFNRPIGGIVQTAE